MPSGGEPLITSWWIFQLNTYESFFKIWRQKFEIFRGNFSVFSSILQDTLQKNSTFNFNVFRPKILLNIFGLKVGYFWKWPEIITSKISEPCVFTLAMIRIGKTLCIRPTWVALLVVWRKYYQSETPCTCIYNRA